MQEKKYSIEEIENWILQNHWTDEDGKWCFDLSDLTHEKLEKANRINDENQIKLL